MLLLLVLYPYIRGSRKFDTGFYGVINWEFGFYIMLFSFKIFIFSLLKSTYLFLKVSYCFVEATRVFSRLYRPMRSLDLVFSRGLGDSMGLLFDNCTNSI